MSSGDLTSPLLNNNMKKRSFSIPMLDLPGEYQSIKADIDAAIARVIASGRFILGEEVASFERELSAYLGLAHTVGLASGTDALKLTLQALGVRPGDEVVMPTLNYISDGEVVAQLGAKPVLVDSGEDMNVDVAAVERALSTKTRAVIAVHFHGLPADVDKLADLLADKKIYLIEDCAQALGAKLSGRKVCTFGTAGRFSFFPSKNLGAYGDAGAVATDDAHLAEELRLIRAHYQRSRYQSDAFGYNSRLDALQAAILRVKLPHLDDWNRRRQEAAKLYQAGLFDLTGKIGLPQVPTHKEHVYYQYAITTPRRDELKTYLADRGIESQIHYPYPLHIMPAYSYLGYKAGDFPAAERLCRETLSLPLYPLISRENVKRVISAVSDFFK